MNPAIQPADLGFFSALARAGSLSAAARDMGVTTAAVSRHLAQMEKRLGVLLVNRTTRRMGLTPEGEVYLEHARRILGDIDNLGELLGGAQSSPQGLLRVNATLGFGRSHIAPLISRFARRFPQVEVQLQLSVNPPPITGLSTTGGVEAYLQSRSGAGSRRPASRSSAGAAATSARPTGRSSSGATSARTARTARRRT